jgi:membrane-associated protease RseP (regulator of RpoE activity)
MKPVEAMCGIVVASVVGAAVVAEEPANAERPRALQMDRPAERPAKPAGRPAARQAAHLGIVTGPVAEELREHADLPERGGLLVTRVEQGSPAARAGLKANDILLEFDGREVASPLDLADMVEAAGTGARVTLGIVRRGKPLEIEVVLGARPAGANGGPAAAAADAAPVPRQGMPPEARDLLAQALAMAQADGGPGATSSVQVQSSTVNGVVESRAVSRDEHGTVEIVARDGRKTVTIRDGDGGEIHAGPLDGPDDFEAVPEDWQDRVRALDDRAAGGLRRPRPLPGGI